MRDYRVASRALVARHTRVPRPARGAERILAALAGPRRIASAVHAHTHTHLAISLALTRHFHRTPMSTGGTALRASPRRAAVRTTTLDRAVTPRLGRRAAPARVPVAVSPVAATHSRDLTVLTARTETRVRAVDRVLSHPGAGAEASPPAQRAAPVDPFRAAHARNAASPAPPSPAELNTITDYVLKAIDHRLIAHNERLGRG